jgi:hypothetical protein
LNTRRVVTLVTELGDKERAQNVPLGFVRQEALETAPRAVDFDFPIGMDHVAFYPRTKVVRLPEYVVLRLASLDAPAATDTFVDLDSHSVVVLR